MDIRRAYRVLVLEPTATKEELQVAYDAESAMLNPDRFTNANSELREHAEKRLFFVTEAFKTVQRQMNFGGVGFSTTPINTPHIPHPKYDVRNFDPNVVFSMPDLKTKPPKLELDWMYLVVGICFLVLLLFTKSIGQAIFYLILASILCVIITIVKKAQR